MAGLVTFLSMLRYFTLVTVRDFSFEKEVKNGRFGRPELYHRMLSS